jgi:Domain of unknown function (DUF397)
MAGHDEVIEGWRKSSWSGSESCVEVRVDAEQVHVRDSKDRRGPVLTFSHAEWRAFVAGVYDGEFGPPAA